MTLLLLTETKAMICSKLCDYFSESVQFCYQFGGYYFFFGSKLRSQPEGELLGMYGDIIAQKISADGKVISSQLYGSRNNHTLLHVYFNEQSATFTLNILSSSGGTFPAQNYWSFELDYGLTMTSMLVVDMQSYDVHLGVINGKYLTRNTLEGYNDYSGGNISSIMDYGDFYLVISSKATKPYDKTPSWVNSYWYYYETVYSAYDKNGNLLWRDSVDSTPDYESLQ